MEIGNKIEEKVVIDGNLVTSRGPGADMYCLSSVWTDSERGDSEGNSRSVNS